MQYPAFGVDQRGVAIETGQVAVVFRQRPDLVFARVLLKRVRRQLRRVRTWPAVAFLDSQEVLAELDGAIIQLHAAMPYAALTSQERGRIPPEFGSLGWLPKPHFEWFADVLEADKREAR